MSNEVKTAGEVYTWMVNGASRKNKIYDVMFIED